MNFKDKYTTLEIKDAVSKSEAEKEVKDKELLKTVVSNDTYLQAEILEELTKLLRLKW